MDLGIAGETALVLGGTQGLGRACAEALAEADARVVLVGRNDEKGRDAAKAIGDNAYYVQGDLADPNDRATLFAAASEPAGRAVRGEEPR